MKTAPSTIAPLATFEPDEEALERLAVKYETLSALRRDHDRGLAQPSNEAWRALAKSFPGALRELDQLPLHELDDRARSLRSASKQGAIEPWMTWVHGYHGAIRASLHIKARAKKLPRPSHQEMAQKASLHAGYPVDDAFVATLLEKGRCRITELALALVAERAGVDPSRIREVLLPRARR